MDGQDRKLQLTKVKTGNAGLSCYVASKIDIVILLTKTKYTSIYCISYSTKPKKVKFYISFLTLYFTLHINIL